MDANIGYEDKGSVVGNSLEIIEGAGVDGILVRSEVGGAEWCNSSKGKRERIKDGTDDTK